MSVWGQDEEAMVSGVVPAAIPPKAPAKTSAWSAIPRGIAAGGMEMFADATGLRMRPDPEGRRSDFLRMPKIQADPAERQRVGEEMSRNARDYARSLQAEPGDASAAEAILFGAARGITKAATMVATAGPAAGAVAFGGSETASAYDDLTRKGVDGDTALKAAAGIGVLSAVGVGLPMAGQSLRSTAALYVAGGPGGYVAQQALTREILQRGGYQKQAQEFDPFDPVGMAVAALVPLPFAAMGLRANRAAARAKAGEDFRAGPVPSEQTPVAQAAGELVPREVVDAAMVSFAAERRAAAQIHVFGKSDPARAAASSAAHSAALDRALEQMAAGQRVDVADLLPAPPSVEEFRGLRDLAASLEADRAALLPDAGALADRGEIAAIRQERALLEQNRPDASPEAVKALAKQIQAADGVGFKAALSEAKKQTEAAVQSFEAATSRLEAAVQRNAQAQQATNQLAELDARISEVTRQLEEAAPFATFRDAIADAARQAVREAEPARTTNATPARQAPQPEAAAPARGAGAQEPAPTAAPAGRPGAEVEAAGLTPGAKAEAQAAPARVDALLADNPDMLVMLDGMEKPMRLADFMAAVKAEADEMVADAPLLQVAAECALTNGFT